MCLPLSFRASTGDDQRSSASDEESLLLWLPMCFRSGGLQSAILSFCAFSSSQSKPRRCISHRAAFMPLDHLAGAASLCDSQQWVRAVTDKRGNRRTAGSPPKPHFPRRFLLFIRVTQFRKAFLPATALYFELTFQPSMSSVLYMHKGSANVSCFCSCCCASALPACAGSS